MSEPENFIARWSRRKREAAEEAEATTPATSGVADERTPADDDQTNKAGDAPAARSDASGPSTSGLDWTKLPPIETITAESDIRAFLAPGVPPDLTRAALRRVWATDPKIRDFVGLADYDWDFNKPGAITGFGPLEMTDELRRQVMQMVGRSLTDEGADRPDPTPAEAQRQAPVAETPLESAVTTPAMPLPENQSNQVTSQRELARDDSAVHNLGAISQRNKEYIATQNDPKLPDNDLAVGRRPHGRALPK